MNRSIFDRAYNQRLPVWTPRSNPLRLPYLVDVFTPTREGVASLGMLPISFCLLTLYDKMQITIVFGN